MAQVPKAMSIEREVYKKYYKVGSVLRPTKLAAGMTYTAYRSGHSVNADALSLVVSGTTDRLARSYYHHSIKKIPHYTYVLSDTGKRKLARKRLLYASHGVTFHG